MRAWLHLTPFDVRFVAGFLLELVRDYRNIHH